MSLDDDGRAAMRAIARTDLREAFDVLVERHSSEIVEMGMTRNTMSETHVLSLGAGVQSTTMLLMAAKGLITPMPVAAIFADTQSEPQAVYRHLDWLEAEVASVIPLVRVTAGNLVEEVLHPSNPESSHVGQPPFFVISREKKGSLPPDSGGRLWRKCTSDFKLLPLRRATRALHDRYGRKPVVQWIGISLEENQRMRDSDVKYIANRYPLVEMRMTRRDCEEWLRANGYPIPVKSACWMCPFKSKASWRELRNDHPVEWRKAVEFDEALRAPGFRIPGTTGDVYVYRGMVPLSEADLDTAEDKGQLRMTFRDRDPVAIDGEGFVNECEGLCGV